MKGKTKEQKLIVRPESKLEVKEVLDEVRNFLGVGSTIIIPQNMVYKDTYFDDDECSLLEQGGSLKIREGVINLGTKEKYLVMRVRTKNPKKLKIAPWDEVEVESIGDIRKFSDNFQPLKGLFPEFDFTKINQEPILICTTVRSQYQVVVDETSTIKLLFDHVEYESKGKKAADYLLKIRSAYQDKSMTDALYKHLAKKFSEYEFNYSSRYERALEKLNSI